MQLVVGQRIFTLLLKLHGTNLAGETEQVDKAFCIVVIVQVTGCEGCDALIVQRVRGSSTGFDDIALVEFEFYFTGYVLLGGFDECLHCFAKRCKPFPFVYDLCKLVAEILL